MKLWKTNAKIVVLKPAIIAGVVKTAEAVSAINIFGKTFKVPNLVAFMENSNDLPSLFYQASKALDNLDGAIRKGNEKDIKKFYDRYVSLEKNYINLEGASFPEELGKRYLEIVKMETSKSN